MRRLSLDQVIPSAHFMRVRDDRGVSWAQVAKVLSDPHVTEAHAGHVRYVRDGLVIVVAERGERLPVLVTLLARRQERWDNDDVRVLARRLDE